ncbi:MAG: EcsC family protein [Bradymonadaceae bacterium]|nr:EcsC family protein [Lujinxingiaceae bacterium]
MARIFVTPKREELAQAGLLDEGVVSEELGAQELLVDPVVGGTITADGVVVVEGMDIRAHWKVLRTKSLEEVLHYVASHFADAPQARREILATWMARELGYSRLMRRKQRVTVEPLWDVLSAHRYAELSAGGEQALWMIATAMRPHRTSLHPMAALAAIALWRHTTDAELKAKARGLLEERSLPDDPRWLYELVGELEARGDDNALLGLVDLELGANFWEVAAQLCGLHLVRKYAQWYAGSSTSNLTRACDRAAEQHPREDEVWLQRMADAAIGGRLSFAWLEKPIGAAIRRTVGDSNRQSALRQFHKLRLYDADYRRLDHLYNAQLEAWHKHSSVKAYAELLEEVDRTTISNPTRAQRLLELMITRNARKVGSLLARIEYAIDHCAQGPKLDELEQRLIAIYVRNYAIESHAVRLVRRTHERIAWGEAPLASHEDLEMYLVISDYERAFEQLTCKFDGVTMEHADKNAAARTKIFVERRLDPSRITRAVRTIFTPMEWLGASIAEISLVSDAVERGMQLFESRTARLNLSEEVMGEFGAAGFALEDYAAIAKLPVDRVDTVLRRQRQQRLLLGAVAGGISGGLAPFSWGVLSLADVPIVLGLTGDICSRFCWFYGFDPREQPELPMEILAVALGGSRPSAIEPMLLRQNLCDYVVHKSVMVGALAHGGGKYVAGRSLSQLVERQMSKKSAEKVSALARRTVMRNLQRRAAEAAPSKTLPIVGALLGATLNVALLYDICEAAQAVLTDRFLERKYPLWMRQIGDEPLS